MSPGTPHPPFKRRLRTTLKWLHLWLGLSVGALFAVIALSGTVLAFQRELLMAAHPEWSRAQAADAPTPGSQARGRAMARIVSEWRARGMTSLDLPSAGLPVWQAYLPGNERRYFDPASGELLLVRTIGNDPVLFLRDLHAHLLSGKTGEAVLGVMGLITLLLIASGLYLWWPRWSALAASLRFYSNPPTRRWFSWHRSTGALLLPMLLLAVLTGVAQVYDDATRDALRAVFRDPPSRKAPKLAAEPGPIDWAATLALAERAMPGIELRRLTLPKNGSGLVAFRARMPGEWHPVGRSMVWIDPYRQKVLGTLDATREGTGTRISQSLYPLHGGFVGGRLWQALIALTGLAPPFLLVSGFLFWRRRRGH